MGLVKTPWPLEAEDEHKRVPVLLEEMKHMIGVIHSQGLSGKRRNPHLITALAPVIREHCRELINRLYRVSRLYPDGLDGQRPYWVRAVRTMIDDLDSMRRAYEDLENFHDRRGNLEAALLYSRAALQGIDYLKNTFESIPAPGSRQTTPIEPPEMSEMWQEFVEALDLSGLDE